MSLVFVDKEMTIGLAVPYLGSEVCAVKSKSVVGGFNWLLQAHVEKADEDGKTVQIRDMTADAIARQLINYIPKENCFDDVDKCTKAILSWDSQDNVGKLISVSGVLRFSHGANQTQDFSPTAPPTVTVNKFSYNQRECFACELTGDNIALPVYLSTEAAWPTSYYNAKLVKIIGSLGWVPFYNVGRQRSINYVLCGAAIWAE